MLHVLHDGTRYNISIEGNGYQLDLAKGFAETRRKNGIKYTVYVCRCDDSLEDDWTNVSHDCDTCRKGSFEMYFDYNYLAS